MTDYDNPEVEARWLAERRDEVANYLNHEGISHGTIREKPAWHIAPIVSIWAIENLKTPNLIEWWAISGDLPNDYISANNVKSPKEAMHAIASLWKEVSQYMGRGDSHPTFVIGTGESGEELASMLASRAEMLLNWSSNPEMWENEL